MSQVSIGFTRYDRWLFWRVRTLVGPAMEMNTMVASNG